MGDLPECENQEKRVIKVAAFTNGKHQPTSRFRVRQYIEPLRSYGIELNEFFTGLGSYPPLNKPVRPFWAIGTLLSRLPSIVQSYSHDVTVLQREMLSTFFTLEGLTKKPRILDVDDAIWLNRKTSFARRLAGICDSVICGNSFLADYFSQWCSRTVILPTAVDTDRFKPLERKPQIQAFTIGWSGGFSGLPDLRLVEKPLQVILKKHPEIRFRVISNQPPNLALPASQVEFVRWSPEVETQAIQTLDVGIMPLRDIAWSYGKCAYKMLLYMSCGVPVIVSPIGMNQQVSQMAPVGANATTADDWVGAIEEFSNHRDLSAQLGKNGRDLVIRHFSRDVLAPKLASEISHVAGYGSQLITEEVHN